jgi:4-amino-4-deoxy-L-arabinose transferase-like glycosyltransferase
VSRVAWLLVAAVWFGTLGIRPLYKADESRYGEISREMAASGDWLTPRLNGFKYFEKPPLQYWATAAAFEVFGVHDWSARLWTALMGFAGLALTLRAGNRLFGKPIGFYAAAILAGSPLYALLGQINTLDMGVTFFLSAAVFAFAAGHMLVFWAACALAVLSKGLIGIVLPLAAVFLYMLVTRDWSVVRRIRPLAGPLLFMAIAAPWFIAVSAANPEFAHFFFVQEHFQRFTSEMHGRGAPAWYFVAILAAGMAPWLLLLGLALYKPLRSGERTQVFLLIWALVVLAFFSASHSKLSSYILPAFPALALLVARHLERRLLAAQCALVAVASVAAAIAILKLGGSYAEYAPWLAVAAVVLAVAAAAGAAAAWRGAVPVAVALLGLGGLAATQIGLAGHVTVAERFTVAPTLAKIGERPSADAHVFAVDIYDHTLPWTLKRTVAMVKYRDELGVAIGWEPLRFVPDLPAFARAWREAPKAWAFVAVGDLERLRRELGLPMQELARGPTYAIVKKP